MFVQGDVEDEDDDLDIEEAIMYTDCELFLTD